MLQRSSHLINSIAKQAGTSTYMPVSYWSAINFSNDRTPEGKRVREGWDGQVTKTSKQTLRTLVKQLGFFVFRKRKMSIDYTKLNERIVEQAYESMKDKQLVIKQDAEAETELSEVSARGSKYIHSAV